LGEGIPQTVRCVEEERRMNVNVKIRQGLGVFCQKDMCQEPATHLFRDQGRIAAYCENHATAMARRIGITLAMRSDYSDIPIHRRFGT
jgi:hypothetical protein